MKQVSWPYFDPEFENLAERIYGPSCRVCVDNECCSKCTVVKVDSINKQGLLLEVVQVLTEMDLDISKSYISSDAAWFMDVFHVRDKLGDKVTDQRAVDYLQQAISARRNLKVLGEMKTSTSKISLMKPLSEGTAIEIAGPNRPGLFSEISAVLADLRCNIVEAHAWSHNACLACVAYVSDESTSSCISDPNRLATIEDHLYNVLRPSSSIDEEHATVKMADLRCCASMADVERRLHQLMLASRDFDGASAASTSLVAMHNDDDYEGRKAVVSIEGCSERGYSVVNVECIDRPRLMFDTLCTLTDMQYAVFHASIRSHGSFSHQEYYIRHLDGCLLNSEGEKEQVVKCLEAAIERRVCEGVRLELRTQNSVGLLPSVTRILREHGLTVARADIETLGEQMVNVFYVRDIYGNDIDMRSIESVRREMEPLAFEVNIVTSQRPGSPERPRFSFSSMLRSQMQKLSHAFISS